MEKLSQKIFQKKIRSKKDFLAELYDKYGTKLYSYAIHSWKLPEDEAWDLIYKTLYRVIDVLPKYDFKDAEKFQSFIFTTFINYIKNHFRDNKLKREHVHIEVNDDTLGQTETEEPSKSTDNQLLGALERVLEDLEDWQRILVLMRSDGRPYSEISKFVDKPEKQLKVYYQRIKERIIQQINEK